MHWKLAARLAIASLTLTLCAISLRSGSATAKEPGSEHCYNDVCHRVRTIAETERAVGVVAWVKASFYGPPGDDGYNPRTLTSSGERFEADRADNVASPIWPDGTILLLRNPATRIAAVVRVNNAGPYWENRELDASEALARAMGFHHAGVARLEMSVLRGPTAAETRYLANRKYVAVAGIIGKFETIEQAFSTGAASLGIVVTATIPAPAATPPASPAAKQAAAAPAPRRPRRDNDDDDGNGRADRGGTAARARQREQSAPPVASPALDEETLVAIMRNN